MGNYVNYHNSVISFLSEQAGGGNATGGAAGGNATGGDAGGSSSMGGGTVVIA
jgi:hypothetical protein